MEETDWKAIPREYYVPCHTGAPRNMNVGDMLTSTMFPNAIGIVVEVHGFGIESIAKVYWNTIGGISYIAMTDDTVEVVSAR
jgi:hypothetical protein